MKVEKVNIKELGFTEQLLYGNDIKDNKIKELEEENKKLQEKVNTYSEEYGKLREENKKLKDIIDKIVYLYKEEPTELEEYVKSGFKGGMSN